jgi:hypothetical protein
MAPDATLSCPRCGTGRVAALECPRCGVIYAKARPSATPTSTAAQPVANPPEFPQAALFEPGARRPVVWVGVLDEARAELFARTLVPPLAVAFAWLLVSSPVGHMVVRTFLSMWIHELGHAASAWLCGFGAFPGPWRTPVSAERMPLVSVAIVAALGWLVHRGRREGRWMLAVGGVGGIVLHVVCLSLSPRAAQMFITFGGDGGGLVLGALLMATFYAGPESRLYRGSLRWGLVGIGAASVVDAFHTWTRAYADRGEIPLGEIEGVGLSDASKLTDLYGWTYSELTGRYVALGVACLVAIAAMYVLGVVRARARVAVRLR